MNHQFLKKSLFYPWCLLSIPVLSAQRWGVMAVFFLATFLSWNGICCAAEPLPSLPETLSSENTTTLPKKTIVKTADFSQLLDEHGFGLEKVRSSGLVPPIFVINLPSDLSTLPIAQKTSLFIRLLLPHVVSVNSEILKVRKQLQYLIEKMDEGKELSASENRWLANLATAYSGDVSDLDDLLSRTDIIPTALVLAQAIDESGWGTSHFAVNGNALYGEHLPAGNKGKFITTPGGHIRVEVFESIYDSTANYVHTLNTTRAYNELREQRKQLRENNKNLTGDKLAGSLASYSALGEKYDRILKSIITRYRLDAYDNVELDDSLSGLLVEFVRK